ncbi:hypothetical protein KOW79_010555 [Hemibagrus wyckioides]|uniref:Uncharacterized protein n=1 Tax=Hemibagrus wyckioides TaxID=337641 RepID=A0A9D3NNW2_9TELE|nr:hypothetical protein KOW79_010555 [Hemibagrus wyckioides]
MSRNQRDFIRPTQAVLPGIPGEFKTKFRRDLTSQYGLHRPGALQGGWVMWYSGNIEGLAVSKEMGHIGNAVDRIARTLSRKMRTHRAHQGP